MRFWSTKSIKSRPTDQIDHDRHFGWKYFQIVPLLQNAIPVFGPWSQDVPSSVDLVWVIYGISEDRWISWTTSEFCLPRCHLELSPSLFRQHRVQSARNQIQILDDRIFYTPRGFKASWTLRLVLQYRERTSILPTNIHYPGLPFLFTSCSFLQCRPIAITSTSSPSSSFRSLRLLHDQDYGGSLAHSSSLFLLSAGTTYSPSFL